MSQSDYIFLKRIGRELKDISHNLDPILTSRQYTDYKLYTLAYNIPNTKTVYSQITPNKIQEVFDMERPPQTDCSGFQLCQNTNKRANRRLDGYDICGNIWTPAKYPKNQNTDLFRLSYPGYMNHLKSIEYINANLCAGGGTYQCNNNVPITKKFIPSESYPASMQSQTVYPNAIQKNASYAGYNMRKVGNNYANLLQATTPAVPFTVIPPVYHP
jgi:hypothetical protein